MHLLNEKRMAELNALGEKARMVRLNPYFLNQSFMMVPYGMGNSPTILVEADVILFSEVLRDGLRDLLRNADEQAA